MKNPKPGPVRCDQSNRPGISEAQRVEISAAIVRHLPDGATAIGGCSSGVSGVSSGSWTCWHTLHRIACVRYVASRGDPRVDEELGWMVAEK